MENKMHKYLVLIKLMISIAKWFDIRVGWWYDSIVATHSELFSLFFYNMKISPIGDFWTDEWWLEKIGISSNLIRFQLFPLQNDTIQRQTIPCYWHDVTILTAIQCVSRYMLDNLIHRQYWFLMAMWYDTIQWFE